ncbi:potassium channel family protein [Chelatococcus asaccharovorans]|uniref:Ion channel n=2 Tax=Chelatococcus asaccharovorans TaxID=28210 RepID=A0A2V3UCG8_9HYPH|nr:potassium channel family protein [Chelatococcus asaccharovorans]MBS7703578.1 two pore domain potassium channel family protein [Chelatococcus asaccharovorans]PXW61921.1 ion channel [Chelatococcus asaccharovorans]CAH1669958.1 Ion channel [Chelatococcus asaccharovorans]CAH1678616.1 Ion channel [Chelatococcus asaccharovorans]
MLGQLLVGIFISLCNIAAHAVVMTTVVRTARGATAWAHDRPRSWLPIVMVATATVLLATHVAEVFLWAATYAVLQVIPVETEAIYFAFVNYTTLGYGDILPAAEWRLLGPMAAMNGILLFGWSTAVIFEVLRHAMLLHGQTGPEPR